MSIILHPVANLNLTQRPVTIHGSRNTAAQAEIKQKTAPYLPPALLSRGVLRFHAAPRSTASLRLAAQQPHLDSPSVPRPELMRPKEQRHGHRRGLPRDVTLLLQGSGSNHLQARREEESAESRTWWHREPTSAVARDDALPTESGSLGGGVSDRSCVRIPRFQHGLVTPKKANSRPSNRSREQDPEAERSWGKHNRYPGACAGEPHAWVSLFPPRDSGRYQPSSGTSGRTQEEM
ncbi:hypothetical protein B0T14DRAFT_336135 [Immersiella caudata]|uniref:Uncharacterized protein n=1 Tax=Immersiella caudata TaxID=314043 RepID=A0AA39T1V9_9PEZI|nr:hypothetical protein B0T14DRAFT_336135 [Immersiella caudata]